MVGDWEWVSARDAWTGHVTTPATEGYTIQLEFLAEGTAIWFRDGAAFNTMTWEFRTSGIGSFVFLYLGGLQHICEVTQTSLWLDRTFVDGPLMIFARREPVPLETRNWGAIKALFR